MSTLKILAIAGSLRKKSFNRALVNTLCDLAPSSMRIEIAEIADLPFYNADIDVEGGPDPVRKFKAAIADAHGIIIATPEYNYGIPGVLKNAIDWASRPSYQSVFVHKPVAILGASMSVVGTARAQAHLKQVLLSMLAEVFPYPEVLIATAQQKFNASLELSDEVTKGHLSKMLSAYEAWVRARKNNGL